MHLLAKDTSPQKVGNMYFHCFYMFKKVVFLKALTIVSVGLTRLYFVLNRIRYMLQSVSNGFIVVCYGDSYYVRYRPAKLVTVYCFLPTNDQSVTRKIEINLLPTYFPV